MNSALGIIGGIGFLLVLGGALVRALATGHTGTIITFAGLAVYALAFVVYHGHRRITGARRNG